MLVVADNKIPFLQGVLEPFAEVLYLPAHQIDNKTIAHADALIVRTTVKCDKNLLDDTKVRFIATATIGFDHIDVQYLQQQGIVWSNAAGCNAWAVAQYVVTALFYVGVQRDFTLKNKTIGIVGVGHVGSKVALLCQNLGMHVLLNDPPREQQEQLNFVSLQQIQHQADFITFHTPLVKEGLYKTQHLADNDFFKNTIRAPFIINSSRGAVVDNHALYNAITQNRVSGAIIDTWENEPNINQSLLQASTLATPHIAGYSTEGKATGTAMSVQNLARFFGWASLFNWTPQLPDITTIPAIPESTDEQEFAYRIVKQVFDIEDISNQLKSRPELFEQFRAALPNRRQFESFNLQTDNKILKQIGF